MTVMEQYTTAVQTRNFLSQWGLKQKFVAKKCKIPETVFSGFVNGKLTLNVKQLERVIAYTNDYVRRNS